MTDMHRDSFYHLKELCDALNGAFISSWQSTHAWQKQLDAANDYIRHLTEQNEKRDSHE